jgi:hypothetical protein
MIPPRELNRILKKPFVLSEKTKPSNITNISPITKDITISRYSTRYAYDTAPAGMNAG